MAWVWGVALLLSAALVPVAIARLRSETHPYLFGLVAAVGAFGGLLLQSVALPDAPPLGMAAIGVVAGLLHYLLYLRMRRHDERGASLR